jgi:hypothetical protein
MIASAAQGLAKVAMGIKSPITTCDSEALLPTLLSDGTQAAAGFFRKQPIV